MENSGFALWGAWSNYFNRLVPTHFKNPWNIQQGLYPWIFKIRVKSLHSEDKRVLAHESVCWTYSSMELDTDELFWEHWGPLVLCALRFSCNRFIGHVGGASLHIVHYGNLQTMAMAREWESRENEMWKRGVQHVQKMLKYGKGLQERPWATEEWRLEA